MYHTFVCTYSTLHSILYTHCLASRTLHHTSDASHFLCITLLYIHILHSLDNHTLTASPDSPRIKISMYRTSDVSHFLMIHILHSCQYHTPLPCLAHLVPHFPCTALPMCLTFVRYIFCILFNILHPLFRLADLVSHFRCITLPMDRTLVTYHTSSLIYVLCAPTAHMRAYTHRRAHTARQKVTACELYAHATREHTDTRTRTHTHTSTCTCTSTSTHKNTHKHTNTRTDTLSHTPTHMHARHTQTQTQTQTHLHPYTHTNIHTQ